MAEPMTFATDVFMALVAGWLGRRLWLRRGEFLLAERWAWAFGATAAAALLGGSYHGVGLDPGAASARLLWGATMVSVGLAGTLLLLGALERIRPARIWGPLLTTEWMLYTLWVACVDSDFRYAVWQYGGAMLLVLAIHVVLAVRGLREAAWVVAGIGVSLLGAWIQQAGLAPHARFNHNDLYHVIQTLGLVLIYLGARGNPSARTA